MRASPLHSRIFAILLSLLLAALVPGVARASQSPAVNHIAAELVAEGPVAPGQVTELAIHFRPDKGWHGYWSNPGDAGYGMTLGWTLPPGAEAGRPLYPVPQVLVIGGLMNHVYEREYAVLVPLRLPRGLVAGTRLPIELMAEWLACTDAVCLPESATLSTIVTIGGGDARDPRFDAWRAAIPPLLDSQGHYQLTGGTLRLAIPLPRTVPINAPHVFIETDELVQYAAAQSLYRKGDSVIAEVPLRPGAKAIGGAVSGILATGDGEGFAFSAAAGTVPRGGIPLGTEAAIPSLGWLVLAALLGGLVLNIMPCVFPILSLKALSLARAGESEAQARAEGLAYTAGTMLACLALGGILLVLRAGGEQIGWAFQLQEPGVVFALLLLAAAITANFAGLFELPGLSLTRSGQPAGAFATGLLAAVVATPCTGPFMATAIGAALLLPVVPALALFAALGLGLALPFLALGFVPALRRRMPRPGPWMERFRRWMALPMGLTALALLWLAGRLGGVGFALVAGIATFGLLAALWAAGRRQRAGRPALANLALIAAPFALFAALALPHAFAPDQQEEASLLAPHPFSEAELARARASGKPVFVWFTADWCITCKVNEKVAIERAATRDAFARTGVIALRGDWTRREPAITRFLTQQGAAGVPLYLWYAPGGEAQRLPQVLSPGALPALAAGSGDIPPATAPASN